VTDAMKILIIICCCIGGLAVIAGLFFLFFNLGMGEIRKLVIKDVDLSKITDGVFEGKYHKGRWTYDLQVTIKDHKIVAITSTNKRMDMFKEINAKIAAEMINKQSTKIDVVSGATIFTRAYQKAVENALSTGSK
jgi:uncharacterized protein with FMN-binding domain